MKEIAKDITKIFKGTNKYLNPNEFNGKEVDIPSTWMEIKIELVKLGWIDIDKINILTIDDLEKKLINLQENGTIVDLNNYLSFLSWKEWWSKFNNPIISFVPPRSKKDIEIMPHIILDDSKVIEELREAIVLEEDYE